MLRSVDWVLAHTDSMWRQVILDRIAAGVGPEPLAELFVRGTDTFATVRFDGGRADLVLAVNHAPARRRA
jgi:hypothetical protein